MVFLATPGITFPLATCYFKTGRTNEGNTMMVPFYFTLLSMALYFGIVWLFLGEWQYILMPALAGFSGSFCFQIAAKYILKKELSFWKILLTAGMGGFAFFPYSIIFETNDRYIGNNILLGLAIFLWTIINGALLNNEYQKATKTQNQLIRKDF